MLRGFLYKIVAGFQNSFHFKFPVQCLSPQCPHDYYNLVLLSRQVASTPGVLISIRAEPIISVKEGLDFDLLELVDINLLTGTTRFDLCDEYKK